MPLPATINPVEADDTTVIAAFANPVKTGNTVTYSAPSVSGNADLTGQPTLRCDGSVTKNGIVQSLLQMKLPVWDATAGEYNGYIQVSLTVKRQKDHTIESVKDAIHGIGNIVDTNFVSGSFRDALGDNAMSL